MRARVSTIIMLCAHEFAATELDIVSPRRAREAVQARHVAIYLARQLTLLSLSQIGRQFGDRDHTTVLHAVRRMARLMAEDAGLRGRVVSIERDVAAAAASEIQGKEG